MANELVKYDAACHALTMAKNVDEVKTIRDKAEAMRAYGRVAKNRGLEIDAAEIRIRAERRLGEMIREQKETIGLNRGGGDTSTGTRKEPVRKVPTLADTGIDKKLSSRAQKLAAVPEKEFTKKLGEWRENVEKENERVTTELLKSGAHVMHNSGNNEWYTPKEYIELARAVMGGIDCDPASSKTANETVGAEIYFTEKENGLDKKWGKNVWMNPPYSQPEIGLFCQKLVEKIESEEVENAIVLVNNATETEWGQTLLKSASAICFVRGRIKFIDEKGNPGGAPLQGQILYYFGNKTSEFKKECRSKNIGVVYSR